MASTVAIAAMYCVKITGRETARCAAWLMIVEKRREPGGAIQTFVPRPRPASWVEAVNEKPVGS